MITASEIALFTKRSIKRESEKLTKRLIEKISNEASFGFDYLIYDSQKDSPLVVEQVIAILAANGYLVSNDGTKNYRIAWRVE